MPRHRGAVVNQTHPEPVPASPGACEAGAKLALVLYVHVCGKKIGHARPAGDGEQEKISMNIFLKIVVIDIYFGTSSRIRRYRTFIVIIPKPNKTCQ